MPFREKKQPPFATRKLRLRAFRTSDLHAMHALYGDADNLRHWSTLPSPNPAATRRMTTWHPGDRPGNYVIWAVEESKSRKVIDLCDDPGVHKIEVPIQRVNKPPVALAKRLGFRLEGGPIRRRRPGGVLAV